MPFRDNVSVVVLNYNRPQTTIECLAALRAAPSALIREVLVVDNGSSEENLRALREGIDSNARLIEVGVNRYFGEGNNIGAEAATGDYLVFLNNDAFVTPGWLDEMAGTMAADSSTAAVGALLLYPDGQVQEVGGMVLPTGDVVQIGKGAIWDADHYTEAYSVDYCSASCLLLRKSDFLAVGGFSYEYEPAYYEDTDLCLKLWLHFGKVVVNPKARVVHLESHTTTDRSLALAGIVELNREKFLGAWGDWLARRVLRHTVLDSVNRRPGETPVLEGGTSARWGGNGASVRSRAAGSPSAAVYTLYEVVPGGGERFVFELLGHLSSTLGVDRVVLATPHPYSALRVAQIGSVFGFEEPVAVPRTLDSLSDVDLDLAIVIGNSVVPPVRGFGRCNIYQCQFPFVAPDSYIDEHRSFLADYDEIWVYSTFAARYVNGMARYFELDCPPIRVVNPPATWPGAGQGVPWTERRQVLTVGRFFTEGHDKRQDVVIDVVRSLAERGLSLNLALAGALHTTAESRARYSDLVTRAKGIPCRFYPNASRRRLQELYASSSVLVHAAGFGLDPIEFPERLEHFGIAPVEAASFGCIPVVYAEGGPVEVAAQLGLDMTFRTRDECVGRIEQLLSDPAAGSALSDGIRERADHYSPDAFRKRVSEALEDLSVPGAW